MSQVGVPSCSPRVAAIAATELNEREQEVASAAADLKKAEGVYASQHDAGAIFRWLAPRSSAARLYDGLVVPRQARLANAQGRRDEARTLADAAKSRTAMAEPGGDACPSTPQRDADVRIVMQRTEAAWVKADDDGASKRWYPETSDILAGAEEIAATGHAEERPYDDAHAPTVSNEIFRPPF